MGKQDKYEKVENKEKQGTQREKKGKIEGSLGNTGRNRQKRPKIF